MIGSKTCTLSTICPKNIKFAQLDTRTINQIFAKIIYSQCLHCSNFPLLTEKSTLFEQVKMNPNGRNTHVKKSTLFEQVKMNPNVRRQAIALYIVLQLRQYQCMVSTIAKKSYLKQKNIANKSTHCMIDQIT